jgi:hypothetical protein
LILFLWAEGRAMDDGRWAVFSAHRVLVMETAKVVIAQVASWINFVRVEKDPYIRAEAMDEGGWHLG